MPRLTYYPEQFNNYPGNALANPTDIDFTWSELCKSAITVGRRNWTDVLKYGTYSGLEILWRLAMLRANLQETPAGRLQPTDAFKALDRSEKSSIFYFLGMCLAKLLMEKLFAVPWLLHVDVYKADLNPYFLFPKRPDLVGRDAEGNWAVVEAKGRSWSMPNGTMNTAKQQTRSLGLINNIAPALRVVVGASFKSSRMQARVWDPEEYDANAEHLRIETDRFLRVYYRPVVDYMRLLPALPLSQGPAGQNRRSVEIAGFDASLIVDEDIITTYEKEAPLSQTIGAIAIPTGVSVLNVMAAVPRAAATEPVDGDGERLDHLIAQQRSANINETPDGIGVTLGPSWDPEYMQRPPEERDR